MTSLRHVARLAPPRSNRALGGPTRPDQDKPLLSEETRRILVHKPKLSISRAEELAEKLRLLDQQRELLSKQLTGEVEDNHPVFLHFPKEEAVIAWLSQVQEAVLAQPTGKQRRQRVWLYWKPTDSTKSVMLTTQFPKAALRTAAVIGPRTPLPGTARVMLDSLKERIQKALKDHGLWKLQQPGVLLDTDLSQRLGRLPTECNQAFPNLEQTTAMLQEFRSSGAILGDFYEEGKIGHLIDGKTSRKLFSQGVPFFAFFNLSRSTLALVTPKKREQYRDYARQKGGYWPFLEAESHWYTYLSARQMAGIVRRRLCTAYKDYIALCRMEADPNGEGPQWVETESGFKVPNTVVVVREGQRTSTHRKGVVYSDGKRYKEVDEPSEPAKAPQGVIMPNFKAIPRNKLPK